MTKQKSTKRALLLSALSLLMCVSMLIGSTFAWFTDSVTSAGNKIQAGTLKIDLELLEKNEDGSTKWTSLKDSKAPIFNYDKWEPGYTDVKILKVENEGTLALKWVAKFVSANDLTELANVIDVYVKPSADEFGYANDRTDLSTWTKKGTVAEFVNTISETTYGNLEAGKAAYLGIALKMQESADNKYQGMDLGGAFDIMILATQYTSESDSFNNQYDANAPEVEVVVDSTEELEAALTAGKKIIGVKGSVELAAAPAGQNRDMDHVTLVGLTDDATITVTGNGGGLDNLNLKDIKVVDSTFYTYENGENAWEFTYLELGGTATYTNVVFDDGVMSDGSRANFVNCTFNGHNNDSSAHGNVTMYGAWVYNGEATFTNCTFVGTRGVKVHEAYGSEVGTVVIDNNTFAGLTQKPGVVIGTVNAATTIKITNNVFAATQPGDQNNYKYETDTDVTTFNFVDENNTVTTPVATFAELKEVFEKGGSVELTADIAITELVTIPAGVEVYLDMNGKTITPASANVDPLFDVKKGAALVIDGNGTFDLGEIGTVKGMSLMFPRGDVTINSGTFKIATNGTKYGSMFVGISGGQGKLIINGGYFDGGYYKEGDCFNNCRNLINGSWGQYIRVYGGTFVGQNPAWGDEGMAFLCPHCTHTPGQGYCQALFLEGQSREDTELPAGYNITEGTTADGRPTYTVNYSK